MHFQLNLVRERERSQKIKHYFQQCFYFKNVCSEIFKIHRINRIQSFIIQMKNNLLSVLGLACLVSLQSVVFGSGPNYEDQADWAGDCTIGSIQSPIDINTKMLRFCPKIGYYKFTLMCEDFPNVVVKPGDMSIDAVNQAFAFFFDPIQNSYQAYQGYNLHFHTPSEHTVNGRNLNAEMHIKLRPVKYEVLPAEALGEYAGYDFSQSVEKNHFHAVLGFLFKEDQNAEFGFFDGQNIVSVNGANQTMLNLNNMAGCMTKRFFYEYIGSTTSPTCSEDVRWLVTRDPVPLKPQQLAMIKEIKEEKINNRDTQPLNGRKVSLLGEACSQYAFQSPY